MSKKIIINGITLEGANLIPLLLKVRKWQSFGHEITFFGIPDLQVQIDALAVLDSYDFITLNHGSGWKNKFQFISESLKRNFFAAFYAKRIAREFDIVYTVSPVLDLVLFPLLLKMFNKRMKWMSVFDNTVPIFSQGKLIAGSKIIRILAWFFYRISLCCLKRADMVFVIKPQLRKTLLESGFRAEQLTITGNGVEGDLIRKSIFQSELQSDALFIGRLNEAKGIYDILEVVRVVRKKYPDFLLAIMGRGDEKTEADFLQRIQEKNLEKNIRFFGYRTGQEKYNIIKSSKVFLFLSETESLPIAPLEAVCSGLKTFVYDLDAYDMYTNEEVMIFKKNDWGAVAEKVLETFERGDFANLRGKLLLEKYDWNKIAMLELACIVPEGK